MPSASARNSSGMRSPSSCFKLPLEKYQKSLLFPEILVYTDMHQEGKGQTAHTIERQAVTANPREKEQRERNNMEKVDGHDRYSLCGGAVKAEDVIADVMERVESSEGFGMSQDGTWGTPSNTF